MARIGPLRNVPCPACKKPLPPIHITATMAGVVNGRVSVKAEPEITDGWRKAVAEQHPDCVVIEDDGE